MSYRDELIQVAAEAIAKVWTDDILRNVLGEWETQEPHAPREMMDVILEEVGKACRAILEAQQQTARQDPSE